jgi:hypothetical protein
MSGRSLPTFPITIGEWPRNSRELLRVRINQINNSFAVDIRCWWRDKDALFKPATTGLTLGIRHLPKLEEVLAQARDRAELWGLVLAANSKSRRTTLR